MNQYLKYYPPDDHQMRDFLKICKVFCEYRINKDTQMITFILDTEDKQNKYNYAFEHFNWND